MAMAVVVDKLIAKRLFPDGFDQRDTGRHYRYRALFQFSVLLLHTPRARLSPQDCVET
jgi:hypothetical protein